MIRISAQRLSALILVGALNVPSALALPADFSGTFNILQSRVLGLSYGRGYVLQDGNLILESALDPTRTYCRSGQSTFDESTGRIDVTFQTAADGTEHAMLKTVPSTAAFKSTSLECISMSGFTGALDLSIAFGRVLEIH